MYFLSSCADLLASTGKGAGEASGGELAVQRATAGLDPSFEHWAAVADAYAEVFERLRQGDESARAEVERLSLELQALNREMKSHRSSV